MTANNTIAAISTPPGEGAIGIVRLSGPGAIAIVEQVFTSSRGRCLASAGRRVLHGHILRDGGIVDETLVNVMPGPHTYTREDVVEINCHGGWVAVEEVLKTIIEAGARLAEPGEFTRRAFLNGRIDLTQAEAVMDCIQARTATALRAAESTARGELSRGLHGFTTTLRHALTLAEAAVDFAEEDLPELLDSAFFASLASCAADMRVLLNTADRGVLLREGARVALCGRPNVGKSSLFNALLRDARAIVTDVPGTTRDVLRETVNLDGVPVQLLDMAGFRETGDVVERAGVRLARETMRTANIALLVVDASAPFTVEDEELAGEIRAQGLPLAIALNKADLCSGPPSPPAWAGDAPFNAVSALTDAGIRELEIMLARMLTHGGASGNCDVVITRIRQKDALSHALDALERLLAHPDTSPEFLSMDLRDALDSLAVITGETGSEDVLDAIFAGFCIGK